ncbi:hypothetical protein [Actinopolymorpha rutila]|uniref:Uncharacterized protein n=1 Tax=Actinopolymorpha rutila TaxID=446787 RepID=A0A852ZE80_9ACTN|nr:hypothetical protein [Actinopolymorpha rutila]NYH87969.1 hypothetical protein [Actinopolymorpha rutila]
MRPAPQTWTATGTDVFDAVLNLREQLDAVGVRLCCNGARRNAWASGMQRDMARGRFVYLLGDEPGHPGQVPALDPAPCDQVVTVQEQKNFYSSWLARRTAAGD